MIDSVSGAAYESDLALVREALEGAGVDSTDFGNFSRAYPGVSERNRFDFAAAVPVLLPLLPVVEDPAVKEALVRSLTDRAARPTAGGPLIEEFKRTTAPVLAWVIGNALDVVSDASVLGELVELAQEPAYGRGRQMIVHRLGKAARSDALLAVLIGLMEDSDVALHAMGGVHRMAGVDRAETLIRPLLEHELQPVAQAAAIQLRNIAKARKRRAAKD